ncbi:fibroblast growth factor receptor 2-like [Patiria miniata]|uniref:receptor protein-tyrosine kinase n=1 Tax=Patiria miniata TaxID=46514 RepID=A0A914ANE9_PATMI|nr:fibroblast growth factor receptor 2-like [Patiria miniata]
MFGFQLPVELGNTVGYTRLSGSAVNVSFQGDRFWRMTHSLCGIAVVFSCIGLVSAQGTCSPRWCLNGGTCDGDPPGCLCPEGFAGFYCERTLTGLERCVESLCMNNGACSPDMPQKVACDCVDGFTGNFCETKVCEIDPDCNGGECMNESSSSSNQEPKCVSCPVGFTGPLCQTPFGEFCGELEGMCLNNGSCMPPKGNTKGNKCTCPDNYKGPLCQLYGVCSGVNPCHNNGTCVEGTCICVSPYKGLLCERDPGCTADAQCKNGGTCLDTGVCFCPDGYTGSRCGRGLACTEDNDCLNGGSCNANRTCNCVPYHQGMNCEIGPPPDVTIIITVVAVVVILLVLMVVVLLLVRRRLATKRLRRNSGHEELALGDRNVKRSNAYLGFSDEDKPPVARRPNELNYEPGSKPKEFPREWLHVMEQLGAGSFATVHRAEADGIIKKGTMTTVAVKMLKTTATEGDKSDFEKERSMYLTLGSHPNVVTMLGFCTEKEPFYLIMEYLPNGNLQTYLRHLRTGSKGQYSDDLKELREEKKNVLLPWEILSFAIQIADGMEFLASKSCIHRDLATRNILLGDDLVAKVSDFGLARDIQDSSQYEMKSHGRVPVRWMAPESLLNNIYTSKSDVWGFAVLLWEMVTLGSHPYPGMSSKQVIDEIGAGYRLPKPESCSEEIYDMMKRCWNKNPADRPTFTEICKLLNNMLADASGYLVMSELNRDGYLYLEPGQTKSVNTAGDY